MSLRLVRGVTVAIAIAATARSGAWAAGKISPVDPKPLTAVVHGKIQPLQPGPLQVPVITWGGDVATVLAAQDGMFQAEGLDVKLFAENDFAKQVQDFIGGKTPFLRGTMGMINSAVEALAAAGTEVVVVYQLTWSSGGDTLVVREGVGSPADLKGKRIALQIYGPHPDLITKVLADAGVSPKDVNFVWFKELTLPTYDTKGTIVDPVSAFAADPSLSAVMAISPDMAKLTSNDTVGTGAEGSVKGARKLFSTKTANRHIADVYAVRADYFDGQQDKVRGFVRALLRGQDGLKALAADKTGQAAKWKKLMTTSAKLLFDSEQATADVEGMIGDCEFAGYDGNVKFFTGVNTFATFASLTDEIQTAFQQLGLLSKRSDLRQAGWDYSTLASGIALAKATDAPKFDAGKVQRSVERELQGELPQFGEAGQLFAIEIQFKPNQNTFPTSDYKKDYEDACKAYDRYGNGIVVIEGHADPMGIKCAREPQTLGCPRPNGQPAAPKSPQEVAAMEQATRNLSLRRAQAVRDAFVEYCRSRSIKMDDSRIVAASADVRAPKFPKPRSQEEWLANMRVVFVIKQVEAELSDFTPGK